MSRTRFAFLIAAALLSSGYKFRCYWICTDQTSTQQDYVENRDQCRQYAQLKVDMAMHDASDDDKSRKAQLVSLFSECMARYGWTVPNGEGGKGEKAAAAAVAAPAGPTVEEENKAFLARSSECAFARQSADASTLAAARAKACDAECADRLRAAPEAPRPAACPAQIKGMPGKNDEANE